MLDSKCVCLNEAALQRGTSNAKLVLRFVNDNTGATSIEYALIAGFLSILIIAGVNSIGTTANGTFNTVASALQ